MEEKKELTMVSIKNSKIKQILFFLISMFLLVMVYLCALFRVQSIKEINKLISLPADTDNTILSNFTNTKFNNNKIEFEGWALKLDSKVTDVHILLQSVGDNTDVKVLKTERKRNEEVTTYYNSNWDFGDCGFVTSARGLSKEQCYEIFIVLDYLESHMTKTETELLQQRKKVSLEQYVYDGVLYRYNPLTFVQPKLTDSSMQNVIENGNLLGADLQKGIWIYEYDYSIYWIIDYSLLGNLEQAPEIPLLLFTSQIDKLPKDMQNLGREYKSKYIEEQDYILQNDEKYFVYSMQLPKEYPITYVDTGVYHNRGENKGWIWVKRLRLETIVPN